MNLIINGIESPGLMIAGSVLPKTNEYALDTVGSVMENNVSFNMPGLLIMIVSTNEVSSHVNDMSRSVSLRASLACRTVIRSGMQTEFGHSFETSMHSVSIKSVSVKLGVMINET